MRRIYRGCRAHAAIGVGGSSRLFPASCAGPKAAGNNRAVGMGLTLVQQTWTLAPLPAVMSEFCRCLTGGRA